MFIRNCMEDIVLQLLDEVLKLRSDVCDCERCRADIVAIALNKLPPRYVGSESGQVYIKAEQFDNQYRSDIISALLEGINKVSKNKRH